MADTPRLRLPFLAAAQSQKHVTHNDALQILDALVHLCVVERDRTSPPAAPGEGDAYLVAESPAGAFAGQGGTVASFEDGAWRFHAPRAGWIAYVASERLLCLFDGAAWQDLSTFLRTFSDIRGFGLAATPDAANPFAVRANGGYFVARSAGDGGSGDLRLSLVKEAASGTVSHLYQTAWSGRAETGLAGDDHYRIKVSPDGQRWREAMVVDPASGAVSFPCGIAAAAGSGLGGLRNLVINGDFCVAQRGDGPFPLAPGKLRTVDAWWVEGATGCKGTVRRRIGEEDGPPGHILSTTVEAAGGGVVLVTALEDVRRLAGSTATLSFRYRGSPDASVAVEQRFGVTGAAAAVVTSVALPAAADWTRVTQTFAVPAVGGRVLGPDHALVLRFALGAGAGHFDLGGVQLEEGAAATPLERRPPALELLLARRLFRRSATARDPADLALEMRALPAVSGTGPFDYSAEF